MSLGRWVRILLWGNVVVGLVGVIFDGLTLDLLARIEQGSFTMAEAIANDTRQNMLSFVDLGLYVVTGILFLVWLYRAASNLRKFGAENLRYTPGWAVGSFFVPFMNLYAPYWAVKEVMLESDAPGQKTGTELVRWWWGFWLGSLLLVRLAAGFSESTATPDALRRALWADLLGYAVTAVAAWLAVRAVAEIDARQEARFRSLEAGE